ncbi:hypothetical protein [Hymenobacter metallicola]|uniref:HEPN domain-containing protein n=1 Tax=Hymenobacter metallicola TaxID=2563114 RepID=A0A4Z0Q300_9BACT|nr:hypothetical protein [Hymenobacter metallicola]TGE23513.1 hypothetical protein E5K02_20210 [Hymenobacter metallicola]
MPEWEGYVNKAKHNQKLVELLEEQGQDGFPDWVVIVIFYVALHWICAWVSNQGRPRSSFGSHGDMRNLINPNIKPHLKSHHYIPVSKRVYEAYDELYDFSRTARYDGFLNEKGMREQEMDDMEECKKNLAIIKDFIVRKGIALD